MPDVKFQDSEFEYIFVLVGQVLDLRLDIDQCLGNLFEYLLFGGRQRILRLFFSNFRMPDIVPYAKIVQYRDAQA